MGALDLALGDARYRMSPDAAIRREAFGGLAYRYDNRRLYFVHSKALVELVLGLDGTRSLGEVLAPVSDAKRPAYAKALAALARLEVIVPEVEA